MVERVFLDMRIGLVFSETKKETKNKLSISG
jgi:hypothetical protein